MFSTVEQVCPSTSERKCDIRHNQWKCLEQNPNFGAEVEQEQYQLPE